MTSKIRNVTAFWFSIISSQALELKKNRSNVYGLIFMWMMLMINMKIIRLNGCRTEAWMVVFCVCGH